MLTQLACNATNSAAINKEGGVFVWGKGGFGLLGDKVHTEKVKSNPQTIIMEYQNCKYTASQISMGPYHVAVVVDNELSTKPFHELSYAQQFLKEIKKRIEGRGMTIDEWITQEFQNCQTVSEVKFQQVMMTLFDTAAQKAQKFVSSFLSDLYDPRSQDINLIEFVDQLKGGRTHNGRVFTWGLDTLGRLGHHQPEGGATSRRKNLFNTPRTGTENIFDTMKRILDQIRVSAPDIVDLPQNVAIKMVACGNAHTLALSTDGEVFAWGSGESGCLGLGQEIKRCDTPQVIRKSNNNIRLNNVVQIAVGGFHSMMLTDEGAIYSWGEAENGRLGTGSLTSENRPRTVTYFRKALKQTVIAIACGEAHSAAISSEEELYTWGAGSYGRLGHGDELDKVEPQMIEQLRQRKISLVSCGNFHTMCKSLNGEVYSWGSGLNEKLGHCSGSQKNKKTPFIITGLRKEVIVELCAGPFHNLALNKEGMLFVWGDSFNGKLGLDVVGDVASPTISRKAIQFSINQYGKKDEEEIKTNIYSTPFAQYVQPSMTLNIPSNLQLQKISQVIAGYRNTYFVTNQGQLFGCGDNRFGQLAQPLKPLDQKEEEKKEVFVRDYSEEDDLPRNMVREAEEPVVIPAFSGNIRQVAASIACGYYHVICITDVGRPLSWGRGLEGQLGIGKLERYVSDPTPVERMLDRPCVMAACGERHSLLLTETGDVWAFGENDNGVLGIGVPSTQNFNKTAQKKQTKNQEYLKQFVDAKIEAKPEHVSRLKNVVAIACGTNHSAALVRLPRNDGEMDVYTWGGGWEGKLGNDSHQNVFEPVHVFMPGNAQQKQYTQIACGGSHTILLDTHGHIWFWGRRNRGGLLEMTDSKYEMLPMNLNVAMDKARHHFAFISAGESHNLAIDWTGQLWGFGRNNFSQLISSTESDETFAPTAQPPEFIPLSTLKPLPKNKVLLASAGSQHSTILNSRQECYTWGSVSSSRLGINNPVLMMVIQGKRVIPTPQQLESLPVLLNPEIFKKFANNTREKGGGALGASMHDGRSTRQGTVMETKSRIDGPTDGAYSMKQIQQILQKEQEEGAEQIDLDRQEARFPLQEELKLQKAPFNEQKLIKSDAYKMVEFNDQLNKLFSSLRAVKDGRDQAFSDAQSGIIARLYSFPVKIPLNNSISTKIPLFILKNKQQFQIMVSVFQLHPCYVVRFLFSSNKHMSEKIRLVEALFGKYSLTNNMFKIHTLIVVATQTLDKELQKADFIQFLQSSDLMFTKIFELIYKHQLENRKMMDVIKTMVFFALRKLSGNQQHNLWKFLEIFNDEFNLIKRKFNFEMTKELEWILAMTFEKLQQKSNELQIEEMKDQVSEEEAEERKEFRSKMIENFILNLLLKDTISSLSLMTSGEIDQFYRKTKIEGNRLRKNDLGNFLREIQQNLSGQGSGQNEEEKLGLASQNNLNVSSMAELKIKVLDIKGEIVRKICDQPPQLRLELLKDMVTHGCTSGRSSVTISCRDLSNLRNHIVLHDEEMRVVQKAEVQEDSQGEEAEGGDQEKDVQFREQDPLIWSSFVMGSELVLPQNFTDETVFDRKLNLEIDTRLLLLPRRADVLGICKNCGIPVTDFLVGDLRDKYNRKVDNEVVLTTNLSKGGIFKNYEEYEKSYNSQRSKKSRRKLEFPLSLVDVFEEMLLTVPLIQKKTEIYEFMLQLLEPDNEKQQNINLSSVYQLMEYVKNQQEMKPKDYADRFFQKLYRHLSLSYMQKKDHANYLEQIEDLNKMFKAHLNQVGSDQYKYGKDMENIEQNANIGRGSMFLANFANGSEKILSGKLHRMGPSAKAKRAAIFDMTEQELEEVRNKEKVNAKIQLVVLIRRKIIQQIKLHRKTQLNIIKKCHMNFQNDGEGGFLLTVLYKDDSKSLMQCIKPSQKREATLAQFNVERNLLLELRKISSNKGSKDFGDEDSCLVRFDIFRLVKLLNTIEGYRHQ